MEGISKETLVRLRNKPHQDKETVGTLDWLIAAHCKELQEPWIPIDENTPSDGVPRTKARINIKCSKS